MLLICWPETGQAYFSGPAYQFTKAGNSSILYVATYLRQQGKCLSEFAVKLARHDCPAPDISILELKAKIRKAQQDRNLRDIPHRQ